MAGNTIGSIFRVTTWESHTVGLWEQLWMVVLRGWP